MKITLLTYGTRGDVPPYAVLGQHLARRGHDVTVTACVNLTAMTEQAGLRTIPIPIDSQEFFASERGRSILAAGKTTLFLKELGRQAEAIGRAIAAEQPVTDLIESGRVPGAVQSTRT